MKVNYLLICGYILCSLSLKAQSGKDSTITPKPSAPDKQLKFNLSEDGSRWFQVTFLNQTWARYNQSNAGTTVKGQTASETFDIGLRRTRIQMYGQITDRAFIYFQFGQNNFNYLSQNSGTRKLAAFFHDAVTEYRVSKKNQLKIGGGLTIVNGLSRFSQPSIATIATLDVPVFAQATVDQTDLFSRKLSLYARGQVGKFDYRFAVSQPFPISTNGSAAPVISKDATFADSSLHKQYQGYVMYQFFEHESHVTPGYMTGTYLGTKKVFNIALGGIYQSKATHRLDDNNNKVYDDMKLYCVESFLDMPLNKEKQTAINAYVGFFNYNFGKNYIRFNGIMNPADGLASGSYIKGSQGNAYPMMGTGKVVYSQFAYLLPKKWFGENNTSKVSVYASSMIANYDKVGRSGGVYGVGANWFINGHKAKISAELQNRPTYILDANKNYEFKDRRNSVTVQYQIFI
ncbi:MAG: hypothetical protein U0V72_04380 [Cytophagales bacterium]